MKPGEKLRTLFEQKFRRLFDPPAQTTFPASPSWSLLGNCKLRLFHRQVPLTNLGDVSELQANDFVTSTGVNRRRLFSDFSHYAGIQAENSRMRDLYLSHQKLLAPDPNRGSDQFSLSAAVKAMKNGTNQLIHQPNGQKEKTSWSQVRSTFHQI